MTLLQNRSSLRDSLKIDPNGKVWGNELLDKLLNEGQREIINDPDAYWEFKQTFGYLVPNQMGLPETLEQDDDNPENYMPVKLGQMSDMWASNGSYLRPGSPAINNSNSSAPSEYSQYANKLFLNAGYDSAAEYTTLHNMDTYNGDGTWAATNAEVTTVATDSTTYKEGLGCVSFTVDISGTTNNYGEIENSTITSVDISSINLNQAAIILWVYFPVATYFNEVSVWFGSDASNNYKVRNYQTAAQGNKYAAGWNRIVVPTIRKGTTGSPDMSAVDYLKVRFGYDKDQTDQVECRVDGIQIIDKYIRYKYDLSATDMSTDTDESIIPDQYQSVMEMYAEYKCWSILSGRELKAKQSYQEYTRMLGRMKRELLWNDKSLYQMTTR